MQPGSTRNRIITVFYCLEIVRARGTPCEYPSRYTRRSGTYYFHYVCRVQIDFLHGQTFLHLPSFCTSSSSRLLLWVKRTGSTGPVCRRQATQWHDRSDNEKQLPFHLCLHSLTSDPLLSCHSDKTQSLKSTFPFLT